MADGTHIEWTDATVNAVNGCSLASPGCTNCYAMRLAGTRLRHHPSRAGLTQQTKAGPVWTGEVRLNEAALLQPMRWRRPRRIFWNAHGDLFHPKVPDEWIDRCFAVMALTPQHIHQVLTKRSDRMRAYVGASKAWALRVQDVVDNMEPDGFWKFPGHESWVADNFPLPNVWLGVSVEDRTRMLERGALLKACPAAITFWSAEPLLGDLGEIPAEIMPDWIIVGGESGPKARPMHPDWARSLRDQCAAAGVPFFFKQWGTWLIKSAVDPTLRNLRDFEQLTLDEGTSGPFLRVGKKAAGRLLDGLLHDGMPKSPGEIAGVR